MSLETDGVWRGGLWASTVWADGVWRVGEPPSAWKDKPKASSVYTTKQPPINNYETKMTAQNIWVDKET